MTLEHFFSHNCSHELDHNTEGEYLAITSNSPNDVATACAMIETQLDMHTPNPAGLIGVITAAAYIGKSHPPFRPTILRLLAAFLTTPAPAFHTVHGGGSDPSDAVHLLAASCVDAMVEVSLSAGDQHMQKQVAVECIESLTTSIVLRRHHDSPTWDLARRNVIEAQGTMAEKLHANNIDLIGDSIEILRYGVPSHL
jgi:hypothetical protein